MSELPRRELPWRTHHSVRWEAAPPEIRALLPGLESHGHYNFPGIKQDILWELRCAKVKAFEAIHF